ncbi:RdgB/HAM1 family non-canonical purine NTP pyrophosphatase [Nafulsella turpanensis]|uniref:RdgB/HAM1 family non-canonical purine NTP pyrophosphatase n=1 Tax=Nafulsella turpanensis TaxID=1265690 RepID=UPI000349FFE7|nr:RdgB/HAM1 family non-canonical purine NTP pyrophosphatase [Nafulsella turpanensis]
MNICFATNNAKKLLEIRQLLEPAYRVKSLEEIGCREELPETGSTLEANSLQKAQYVWDHYGIACFADDTGLEIEALGGEPGVYSARYAGPERDNEANIALVLQKLEGQPNRKARFRTLITWIDVHGYRQFEGKVEGEILEQKSGEKGFGYDPVFRPEGRECSFAEMSMEEKNAISHRGRALKKLTDFLREAAN